jgi:hypothetical protein
MKVVTLIGAVGKVFEVSSRLIFVPPVTTPTVDDLTLEFGERSDDAA